MRLKSNLHHLRLLRAGRALRLVPAARTRLDSPLALAVAYLVCDPFRLVFSAAVACSGRPCFPARRGCWRRGRDGAPRWAGRPPGRRRACPAWGGCGRRAWLYGDCSLVPPIRVGLGRAVACTGAGAVSGVAGCACPLSSDVVGRVVGGAPAGAVAGGVLAGRGPLAGRGGARAICGVCPGGAGTVDVLCGCGEQCGGERGGV